MQVTSQLPATFNYPKPYCDLRLKGLKLSSDTFFNRIQEVVHEILRLVAYIAKQPHLSLKHRTLASYYRMLGNRIIDSRMRRGAMIDYACNFPSHFATCDFKQLYKIEYINQFYKNFQRKKQFLEKEGCKFDQTKITMKSFEGICFGMSLEFITLFLTERPKYSSNLDCLKKISPLFRDGGTYESEVNQILYIGLDQTNFLKSLEDTKEELTQTVVSLERENTDLLEIPEKLHNLADQKMSQNMQNHFQPFFKMHSLETPLFASSVAKSHPKKTLHRICKKFHARSLHHSTAREIWISWDCFD